MRILAYWRIVALAFLAASALQVGLWAQFDPRSFYDSFPGVGQKWIVVDGPYNEHLIRDVGGLNLALAVLTIAALWRRSATLVRVTGMAWLVYSVPHLAYHIGHTDGFDSGVDTAIEIGGLVMLVIAPAALAMWPTAPRTAE